MNPANRMGNRNPPANKSWLTAATPFVVLAVVTILAFANAWPNNLVLDDKAFAGPARAPELDSLQYIFTHDLWSSVGAHAGLYRPLLLLDLSFETWLFGDWMAGYHLGNIILHLLVTFLVFGFCRQVLKPSGSPSGSSDFYALLAAMVFAVHPIHTEVVNSVFNRSEILAALFGLGGLWWLLHHLDTHPAKAWSGLAVAYFLGLLSKESAVAIPGLAVILILLVTTDGRVTRLRKCLPAFWLLIPLAVYLALRAQALAPPELMDTATTTGLKEIVAPSGEAKALGLRSTPDVTGAPEAPVPGEPGSAPQTESIQVPSSRSLLEVMGIFGQSMKILIWPYPLRLYHPPPSPQVFLIYAGFNLLLISAALILLGRGHRGLAAGLAFFYIALLPASRVISAENFGPHFAERYVYFPSVGLFLILAFALRVMAQRFSPRAMMVFALPTLVALTAVTWDRNADWVSELSLFGTEYQRGGRDIKTLQLTAAAYLNARNYSRVEIICDENLAALELNGDSPFVESCAVAYEARHRFYEAERAHLIAIGWGATRTAASMSLARFYLRRDRPQDAEKHFNAAIDSTTDAADKELYQAEMIIGLNPKSREQGLVARGHLEAALLLRPGWPRAEAMLQAVDQALSSSRGPAIADDD